ncbi:uncharacterized protein [Montipora capricornis]|uniref:uncharacterized protein isoform X2 n=1 Tax=Montipora capricornis TaxID=246305 RepID=UPI0035F18203
MEFVRNKMNASVCAMFFSDGIVISVTLQDAKKGISLGYKTQVICTTLKLNESGWIWRKKEWNTWSGSVISVVWLFIFVCTQLCTDFRMKKGIFLGHKTQGCEERNLSWIQNSGCQETIF